MAAGGKRAGAGRPRSDASVSKDNTLVVTKLRGGAEQGWEVLAEAYPSLLRLAVDVAQGKVEGGSKQPNVSMLKTLLELLPRVLGTDDTKDDSVLTGLLKDIRAITIETTSNPKPSMDTDV